MGSDRNITVMSGTNLCYFFPIKKYYFGHTIAHTQPDDALLPDIIDLLCIPGTGNSRAFPTNVHPVLSMSISTLRQKAL